MLVNTTKVLLVLPWVVLDRARGLAGRATTTLKLPVSVQIVLRAAVEEGLRRATTPALLANVERQARAIRQSRSVARHGARADASRWPGLARRPAGVGRGDDDGVRDAAMHRAGRRDFAKR
jgi:hypothetical protein